MKLLGMNAVIRSKASAIEPLRLSVPEATLARLRLRLSHGLESGEALDASLSYGAAWSALCRLVQRFETGFELTRQPLFELPCFEARVGAHRVCFIHSCSSDRSALPLLLLHGYSGSLAEFQEQIRPLTNGATGRAHHVVCPSLPGFGLTPGQATATAAAEVCAQLMRQLGYTRYVVHGSELGAKLALELAALDSAHVAAVHVTSAPAYPTDERALTAAEKSQMLRLRELQRQVVDDLPDSPIAELAYALGRVDSELGDPTPAVSDGLLTSLVLTEAFAVAAERARTYAGWLEPAPRSSVPVALAAFPLDAPSLRRAATQRYRIAQWREHEYGGSMPALEQPAVWLESLAGCVKQLD